MRLMHPIRHFDAAPGTFRRLPIKQM